ncbi:hypothetical protein AMELA_G00111330 [Ameiurus melas]|uniref:Uncharacterized protein n=1 Tax=Ameiurus melas TaxID=219545 RepID=A0A7J6AQ09_AMEME|nr:hypothetical protein AMELA_G00111330 [Ameiurus melas]
MSSVHTRMSSVHTKRKSLLTLFGFDSERFIGNIQSLERKHKCIKTLLFDDEESTEMARFFLELHHCMVERNNFTYFVLCFFCCCCFFSSPLSHCKLRVMMRLRICGFLSCRRDSGLDSWRTDCSTSESSERERHGVWTSVNDAECSSMMSFPCTSSPVSYMALLLTLRMHSFPET